MGNNNNGTSNIIVRMARLMMMPWTWTVLAILAVAIVAGVLIYYNKDNSFSIEKNRKIDITPTQIRSIESIGQWEFLAIDNEELVDTVRHGLFGDDVLVRIYYGTLRLGIDMHDTGDDWITASGDSIMVVLPQVKLLDSRFIDESRTRSFYESGKWSHKDRKDMYHRAYNAMTARCLTEKNMEIARQNAITQFGQLMRSMGFTHVSITFDK